MDVFTQRYPAKQGVSEAKLVFARETTMRPGRVVRGMRLPHAPAPSNWSHPIAEPIIPNLLLLGVAVIGATGLQQFWNQKKPLRDN